MTAIDAIHVELARVRERIAEAQIEERVLARLLVDLATRPAAASPAIERERAHAPSTESGGGGAKSAEGPGGHLPLPPAPVITKRRKCQWTEEELVLLRAEYPRLGIDGVERLLPNHSRAAIKTKVAHLALRFTSSKKRPFTAEEDSILARVYPEKGMNGVRPLLPGRSEQSIYNRVSYKGIVRARGKPGPSAPPGGEPSTPPTASPTRPSQRASTFEEQLAAVERGEKRICEKIVIPRPGPERTLGGVTGEIL